MSIDRRHRRLRQCIFRFWVASRPSSSRARPRRRRLFGGGVCRDIISRPVPLLGFPTRLPVPTLATPNRNWELGLTDPGARANLHGRSANQSRRLNPSQQLPASFFLGFLEFPSLHERLRRRDHLREFPTFQEPHLSEQSTPSFGGCRSTVEDQPHTLQQTSTSFINLCFFIYRLLEGSKARNLGVVPCGTIAC